ncbi:MAG: glycosidase, partial [Clostridia bacterium]|nr:glycosidase [Clostridia bacterium]
MAKIIGASLPNIPWQDKPQGCGDVLWRYSQNPIVQRNAIPCSNSIFNSAVVPYKGEFAGVFRVDDKRREMRIHSAFSKDGFNWNIDHEPWVLLNERAKEVGPFIYGYDPRCCQIEGEYIVTWCNCYHGPTIGVAKTEDFRTYYQLENAFLPFNRNGVMFPEKIGGNYAMLSRPSDNGHTPFGDIFYSESPDLCYWGKHRHVMGTRGSWQSTKVGAGPIPIKTDEGWLLFYHGVLTSCNGYVYHFG